MTAPCLDCVDREPGCHGHCDGYKAWKAQFDAAKAAKSAAKADEQAVMGVKMHGMKRIKKQLWER